MRAGGTEKPGIFGGSENGGGSGKFAQLSFLRTIALTSGHPAAKIVGDLYAPEG
jgi:hypothetical protein